ncbi:hypothetical protein V501_02716 [Pseudogymnoascus sp. VKM F-4519 (FW-2642)]|nr:hypothetical protein V501_02716 [Pseudogymnoascus sp. VKM F-4519 (FW-2642)]
MSLEPPPLRKRSSTRTISIDELNRTKYPKTISASFSSAGATTPKFVCNKRTEDGKTGETTNSEIRSDATDDEVSDRITVDSQDDDPAVVERMKEELHQLKTRLTAERKFGRETRKEKGLRENVRVEREIGISGPYSRFEEWLTQMGGFQKDTNDHSEQ